MTRISPLWVGSLLAACGCCGLLAQTILYEETFPYLGASGSAAITSAGWANRIPNNPQRLFQVDGAADGAVYAFQGSADVPITTVFYTTTDLDQGTTGPRFPSIDPALVRGLQFSVDIRPFYDPDNVTSRFAVQMNGTDWFCASTALAVPTAQSAIFSTYAQSFNPAGTNWQHLTLNTSSASMGSMVATSLSGTITGAGLVVRHTIDNGTHDFDNFRITVSSGAIYATMIGANELSLSWVEGPQIRLQRTTPTLFAGWEDMAETLGQSTARVQVTGEQTFYRLSVNGAPPVSTNLVRNAGFEADAAPASTPSDWTTSGQAAADGVVPGGYTGSWCLQHSNAAAYAVETSQLITDLPNGRYRLRAWTRSSGNQNACYLAGNDKLTSVPPIATNWTEMIVRGINVTNGICQLRIVSDGAAGSWCRMDSLELVKDDLPYEFLKGGDISELPRMEHYGGKFYDGTVQKDCLQIMRDRGCNIVRIRMYNDPGNPDYSPANKLDPLGWQNPARTLALAQRAKAMGFQIQLTFHYSDYWSGNDNQTKPHEWEGLSFGSLTTTLSNFTAGFLVQMTNQGTPPEFVSQGNEMQGGILYPDGSYTNAGQLAQLLNAGYGAVKAICPAAKVVLHVNTPKADTVTWFFDLLKSRGVNYDVIGCSYYPFWTDLTTEQARAHINSWQARYGKPVLIMETGYNWNTTTCDGWPGQLSDNGTEPFPSTPLGQKQFLLKCFNDLKLVEHGACIGDIYWDPVFICVGNLGWQTGGRNVVANTTLFDFTGHALPAFDAFRFNN